MSVALYLDRTNEHIEKLLLSHKVPGLTFKFLNPVAAEQGTLEEADYIMAATYKVSAELMAQAPKLKLVARTGVGTDSVDLEYAKEHNIYVTIARGGNAISVAELVLLDMLALLRKVCLLDRTTKEGQWQTWTYRHESFELRGKTVGIIGLGMIGKEVVRRANAFGAHCIYYDIFRLTPEQERELNVRFVSLDELLEQSDLVSLHINYTGDNKGYIGREQFARMKKTAYLINCDRGPLVDEEALVWALDNGEIAGAALDAYCCEPLPVDSPLTKYPNVITTPHLGGATYDAYRYNFDMCIENILAVEHGKRPKFIVNGL